MSHLPKTGIVYVIATIIGVVFTATGTIAFIQNTSPKSSLPTHLVSTTLKVRNLSTSTQNTILHSVKEQSPSLPTVPKSKNVIIQNKLPTSSTPTVQAKTTATTKILTHTKQTISVPATATSTQKNSGDLSSATISIHKALVNITCEIKMTGSIVRTFGSGVFISPKGYIITNAHVAQYLLLKNYPHAGATTCVVRTGGPAKARYSASIVFLSSDWIYAHATTTLKTTSHELENGKHDIAILVVSGEAHDPGANANKIPTVFPFVPLGNKAPTANEPVIIGSYAAQFLSQEILENGLYPTFAYDRIKKLYTFASTTADVVALGGTAVAQEGSSGGGVIDANGKLTALIVIGTVTGPTSTRNLAGITAQYIRRAYASESGKSLNTLLGESTTTATKEFSSTEQKLSTYLKKELAR
ncbi:MAG TPA: serine protease [Candidatus Kaiserbacteria bacterium]|nr:serine protease [Candidatus Kaiserbacteria bacterium]